MSQDANKASGACSVCFATRQLHNREGTVHRHGPRDNPFPGSHKLPLNVSKCSTSVTDSSVPRVSNSAMVDACQVQFSPILSSGEVTLIKHIPKSARGTCALHFAALLRSVVTNPWCVSKWTALFNWGAAIL